MDFHATKQLITSPDIANLCNYLTIDGSEDDDIHIRGLDNYRGTCNSTTTSMLVEFLVADALENSDSDESSLTNFRIQ